MKAFTFTDWDPQPYFDSPKDARGVPIRWNSTRSRPPDRPLNRPARRCRPTTFRRHFWHRSRRSVHIGRANRDSSTKGERRVSPFLVPMMMGNASGAAISMRYGLQGPNETISTACAASTHAIGYAARLIAWGRCDAMVTGGTEAAATPTCIAGFSNMTALSTVGISRPFDVRTRWVCDGRRCGGVHPGSMGVRRGSRRRKFGRSPWLCEHRRRPSHHSPGSGWRRSDPLHAARPRGGGPFHRRHSPDQCARYLNPTQRCGRGGSGERNFWLGESPR